MERGYSMYKTIYFDNDNKIVDRNKATRMIRQKYNKKGELIEEKMGVTNNRKIQKDDTEYEITPEMQKVLDDFERNNKNN